MTKPDHRELEALMNLLEDPDKQVFDTVFDRLIELGEEVVNSTGEKMGGNTETRSAGED